MGHRPKLPKDDVIELAALMKEAGHTHGAVRYPDGMEIVWGADASVKASLTPLEEWKAKKNAVS